MSLEGRTILITRQREQSEQFIQQIEHRGGHAVVIPMIRISDPESWDSCDRALDAIENYNGIVFTSVNGVEGFFKRLDALRWEIRRLEHAVIFAVGDTTRQSLEQRGITVEFVPRTFSAHALIEHFRTRDIVGRKFLLLGGNLVKGDLERELVKCGAQADSIEVYKNSPPEENVRGELKRRVMNHEFDVVTFASPSAITNFSTIVSPMMFKNVQNWTIIAVIGPTTHAAAAELDLPVNITAKESTAKGLAEAISMYYSQTQH